MDKKMRAGSGSKDSRTAFYRGTTVGQYRWASIPSSDEIAP